jgi:hypothetical protein
MADDRYFWAKIRWNFDFEKGGMQLDVSLLVFSTSLPLPEIAYLSEIVIRVPVDMRCNIYGCFVRLYYGKSDRGPYMGSSSEQNIIYKRMRICYSNTISMKNNKYHAVETVPKSNRKIVERGKIDNSNTQIHTFTFLVWNKHFSKTWQG